MQKLFWSWDEGGGWSKTVCAGSEGAREELEVVDKFCYFGDVIGKGGGAEEASRARVRCAWEKLRDLRRLLTVRLQLH